MKSVVAIRQGFHGGTMRKVGEQFLVPDNLHGKWFVLADEYAAVTEEASAKQVPLTLSQLAASKPQSALDYFTKGKKAEAAPSKAGRAADQDVLK